MTSKVFSPGVVIDSPWLNDVNGWTYNGTAPGGQPGASVLTTIGSGPNAVSRTIQLKGQDILSVTDYGATGNNINDDTTSFNRAHIAAALLGKEVYVPSTALGYNIEGTILAQTSMRGEGYYTYLITSNPSADVIQVQQTGVKISALTINASVARTTGYHINCVSSNYMDVKDVFVLNFWNGVGFTGTGGTSNRLSNLRMKTNTAGGIGIIVSNTSNCVDMAFDRILIVGPSSGSTLTAGMQVYNVGDLTFTRMSTLFAGQGCYVSPGVGQVVQAMFGSNSYFDTGGADGEGITLAPTTSGIVQLAKFNNVWTCTNVNGITLSGAGTIVQSEFTNCTSANNSGYGFVNNSSGSTHWQINGGNYSGNTTAGIATTNGSTFYSILGATIGSSGEFGGNGIGVDLGNSNDDFIIANNTISGNTTNFSVGTLSGTPGQTYIIKDNVGFATKTTGALVTLSPSATTTTVTHGLPATPRVQDIHLTPITGAGTGGAQWISAVGSTTFTISTQSNPGASVEVAWTASVWGG